MQKTQTNTDANDNMEEEECYYNEIDKLQNSGINAADITKLKQAGKFKYFKHIKPISFRFLHCS